ncbi:cell division protein ZapB [Klebsiella michiganensis]|uniref:cell division protein ZapB n=1 Tax=Klebsiella michiganensis TaxID=1134687 RepID=UPI002175F719|nr:cell division protein ZapB [Klebsiella michiganensis]UVZ84472.1 cell division protein ZapB [Klebsiella michiganensis]
MTTDITELAQMKGQKVEGSYYLAECTDCGKMYPSNNLNGGEPLFSGDYGECYCPHCSADDAAIGDCGDTAATAWNYQQGRIDALVEALEKAQQRISELEQQNSIANEKVTELSRLVQHNISRAEDAERRAERISKSSSLSHPGLLHATNELVLIFSHALADKLYAAQEKYNHGTSWRNNDWQEACQRDFQKHIAKGDPRDVAAYCAFMWWHGWSTKPAEELESRTVTVKLPEPFKLAKSSSGLMYYFANEVNESLTAAGIKWEAE